MAWASAAAFWLAPAVGAPGPELPLVFAMGGGGGAPVGGGVAPPPLVFEPPPVHAAARVARAASRATETERKSHRPISVSFPRHAGRPHANSTESQDSRARSAFRSGVRSTHAAPQ